MSYIRIIKNICDTVGFERNRQCKPVSTIFRAALSVGQEKLFLEPFSGVYGTVLIALFEYVKGLTNLILFCSGDGAGQILASQGRTVCIPNRLCKSILISTFQF